MPDKADALVRAAAALAAGRDGEAATLLSELVGSLDLDTHPADLTYHVFASALARRLEGDVPDVNLYLRRFDLSQISLFNLLATHLPLVAYAGRLSNQAIAAFIGGEPEVVLLDVGIGTAQQEVALLEGLASNVSTLRRAHVIGIEPSATSLIEAEAAMGRAGVATGIDVSFTAVEALGETLDDEAWRSIATAVDGRPLIINAAFALHHILGSGEGPVVAREKFLGRLRALDPIGVVLAEPNSDHVEPDFGQRFTNCWNHFGTVFRLIDTLAVSEDDRAAMKLFFAREIDDVIANDEMIRSERHEPTDRWVARLEAVGLPPATGFGGVAGPAAAGVEIVPGRGYAGLVFDGELLVSVVCASTTAVDLALQPTDEQPVRLRWTPTGTERIRVRDVMSVPVATIGHDASLAQAAEVLWSSGSSDLSVVDEDGLFVGVLSEGDIIRRLLPATDHTAAANGSRADAFDLLVINGRHAAPQSIEPLIIRDAVVLAPTDDLALVATEMVRRQIRRLPVVTDDRRVVGSVSRADICRVLLVGTGA